MIWILFFFTFLLLSIKDFMFVVSSLTVGSFYLIMCAVSFPVIYVIFNFYFCEFGNFKYFYFLSFFLNILLLNFCFMCSNSFLFLILLELSVVPIMFCILIFSKGSDKMYSVMMMLFINLVGSIPFMFFSVSSMSIFSNFNFFESIFLIYFHDPFIWISMILILCSKIPIFMMHFWLTKAHVSASGSCSMVLASLMLKLGTFGLLKYSFLFSFMGNTLNLIFSWACIGFLFIISLMVRFFDIKFLIACSSISHMSFMFPLISWGKAEGLISCIMMMVGHGLISFFLFFLITLVYESYFNRTVQFSKSLESWSKTFTMVFFLMLFLNLGIPPFLTFYSEVLTCLSLVNFSNWTLMVFMLALSIFIILTMFLSCNLLFMKKVLFSNFYDSILILSFSSLIISSFFLMPFFL